MNLNMIRPKKETDDLLPSKIKICVTSIKQTHTLCQETLEFLLNKTRETLPFKPLIQIEGSWMIGLTSLEVYNSIFNITETMNKFEIYKDTFDGFLFTEL